MEPVAAGDPADRMHVFTWSMAEELAVAHLQRLGFTDARRTAAGADGGLDASATGAVAQVKNHAQPVSAPDVQRLRGAAHGLSRPVFYSRNGFTLQAVAFADRADVALFAFDAHNHVWPVNSHARLLTAGPLDNLVEEASALVTMIRRLKASRTAVAEVLDRERDRVITLRNRASAGDRSPELLAELQRTDMAAMGAWAEEYGRFLADDGDVSCLEKTAEHLAVVNSSIDRGGSPPVDDLQTARQLLDQLVSRQTELVHELAGLLGLESGDLLPDSTPGDASLLD